MTAHDPPPAVVPVHSVEEARRPALALLARLYAADAITLAELTRGWNAILGGDLDELLVPVLDAEARPPIAGSAQGAPPAGPSIGDYLRARGVLN